METPQQIDAFLDFSGTGFDISSELSQLDRQSVEDSVAPDDYEERLLKLAERTLTFLDEGLQRFPAYFSLEMQAESISRSLSGERQHDFALRFNELLYASISDLRPVDAIADTKRLQRAVALTTVADYVNDRNSYETPNKVREAGDAVIGRTVLTMLAVNENPARLQFPAR